MVEELAEAVVRAAGVAARGVAAMLSVPETYAAAAEFAAGAERPRERRDGADGTAERDGRGGQGRKDAPAA
ncbi:hypothetical protein [Streptomyces omiyaensis]|uniref:Uncharacterized protein n=1 Tax=Streptomyces omiyaensis TaxID=68247 RepID=A0ABW7BKZ8_9ACTN|nr:hypothetical protein [Streptomyces omiyaensis]GGY64646.1 hypothetical protein GCM10010363_52520 [Streptomyces omiyaensis]